MTGSSSRRTRLSPTTIAVVICLAALVLRVTIVLVHGVEHLTSDRWGFAFEDGVAADWIARGEGFCNPYRDTPTPTASAPPAHPYFLASLFRSFGSYSAASARVALFTLCLFGSASCWLVYVLGRDWFGVRVGILAALLLAFNPTALYFSAILITPRVVTGFFFLLALHLMDRWKPSGHLPVVFVTGLVLGILILLQTGIETALFGAAAWFLWRMGGTLRRRLSLGLIMGLTALLVCLPWTLRNRRVFGEWIFVRTGLGHNLFIGNHALANGLDADMRWIFTETREGLQLVPDPDSTFARRRDSVLGLPYAEFVGLSESEQNRVQFRQAVRSITDRPGWYVRMVLARAWYFYWPTNPSTPDLYGHFALLRWLSHGVPVLLGLGALAGFRVWNPYAGLLLLLLSLYVLPYALTQIGNFHYRVPIEPALLLLAAHGLVEAGKRARVAANPTAGT